MHFRGAKLAFCQRMVAGHPVLPPLWAVLHALGTSWTCREGNPVGTTLLDGGISCLEGTPCRQNPLLAVGGLGAYSLRYRVARAARDQIHPIDQPAQQISRTIKPSRDHEIDRFKALAQCLTIGSTSSAATRTTVARRARPREAMVPHRRGRIGNPAPRLGPAAFHPRARVTRA